MQDKLISVGKIQGLKFLIYQESIHGQALLVMVKVFSSKILFENVKIPLLLIKKPQYKFGFLDGYIKLNNYLVKFAKDKNLRLF